MGDLKSQFIMLAVDKYEHFLEGTNFALVMDEGLNSFSKSSNLTKNWIKMCGSMISCLFNLLAFINARKFSRKFVSDKCVLDSFLM